MKKEIINTLERAVSTDIVRLQSRSCGEYGGGLRKQLVFSLAASSGGSAGDEGSPQRASKSAAARTVIGGLMVKAEAYRLTVAWPSSSRGARGGKPYGGSSGAPATSRFKIVSNVPASFGRHVTRRCTANDSRGPARIDVVECSVAPVTLEVNGSSVFNRP